MLYAQSQTEINKLILQVFTSKLLNCEYLQLISEYCTFIKRRNLRINRRSFGKNVYTCSCIHYLIFTTFFNFHLTLIDHQMISFSAAYAISFINETIIVLIILISNIHMMIVNLLSSLKVSNSINFSKLHISENY